MCASTQMSSFLSSKTDLSGDNPKSFTTKLLAFALICHTPFRLSPPTADKPCRRNSRLLIYERHSGTSEYYLKISQLTLLRENDPSQLRRNNPKHTEVFSGASI
ncbi:hypothetical protein LOAG_07882 [Loa loa]|uniref:Uncharacterized protein n=1 Tax=Loa loa TaxID=7209 RepID=A0A1S0TUV0_LOALO|nr:hypothetical protein LOAG_07882 [Loa loa]EFO20610.1 hypothetical protein LOAG_07882 [Loa loa]